MIKLRTLLRYNIIFYFILYSSAVLGIETVSIQNVQDGTPLGYQLQYLFDKSNQASLTEILSQKNEEDWNYSNQQELNFGLNNATLWVRFRLENFSAKSAEKVLLMPQAALSIIDIFEVHKENNIKVHKAGKSRSYSSRKIQTRPFLILLEFKPEESIDIYIRAQTSGPLRLPLSLWNYKGVLEQEQKINLTAGIFLGAMLIMFLYNLIVYLELRDKIYLYFISFIASLIIIQATLTNYGFQYLWPDNTWIQSKSFTIPLGLLISFATLFVYSFITKAKRLKQTLKICIVSGFLYSILALFLPYNLALRIGVPLIIFAGVVGIWAVISIWVHGTQTSRYLVIGWTLFLLGGVIMLLSRLALIKTSFFSERGLEIGSIIQVLFLSLALIEKIKRANEERDIAQNHLLNIQQQTTNQLEVRVKDRTAELENTMKKLETANKKLTTLSSVDGLTQLNNRTYFDGTFEAQWKHALRANSSIALLLMDIDHFKRINDEMGHLIGDECLKLIANTIKAQVVRETDTVARYGGEEFVVLLPHISLKHAKRIAEKIRKSISRLAPEFDGEQLLLTISIGIAILNPRPNETTHDLIQMADLSLYKAKKEGRNRVVVADDAMRDKLSEIIQ